MKKLVNLNETKVLSKKEQQSINGGLKHCLLPHGGCSEIWFGCVEVQCHPGP